MNIRFAVVILAMAAALSGCASSRNLLGLENSPAPASQPAVQTSNPLALPPDLALRRPGTAAPAAPAKTVASAPLESADTDYATPAPAPLAPVAKQDVFDKYGVAKINADGTPRSSEQMQKELRAAILKRKQQQNPNYGTIFNMGAIFRDG